MGAFDDLEDKFYACEALDKYSPKLAREAAKALSAQPDLELAGLILGRGTREWEHVSRQIKETTGKDLAGDVFTSLVTRESFESMLIATDGLDGPSSQWLAEKAPTFLPDKLPVMAVMKTGMQGTVADIPRH